jgi:hypothetical protein
MAALLENNLKQPPCAKHYGNCFHKLLILVITLQARQVLICNIKYSHFADEKTQTQKESTLLASIVFLNAKARIQINLTLSKCFISFS